MKKLIIVIFTVYTHLLFAQKFNIKLEAGGSIIGTMQTDIWKGSQQSHLTFKPNVGIGIGYSIFKKRLELSAGCIFQRMTASYRYDSFILTGIEKNFPKINTNFDMLRIPINLFYKIKVGKMWLFSPSVGTSYCIIFNDSEVFPSKSGTITRKNDFGIDAVLKYRINYHNLRSNVMSLDYGFSIERQLSSKISLYFNTFNQYYFNSILSQFYYDNLDNETYDAPGVLTSKTSTLSFNIGVKKTFM